MHWPGKGGKASKGKVWKCVVPLLTQETMDTGNTDPALGGSSTSTGKPKRSVSRGKYEVEQQLAVLERQKVARELSAAAEESAPDPTSSTTPQPGPTILPASATSRSATA